MFQSMSYDIDIWSCLPLDHAKPSLIELGFHESGGHAFTLLGKTWQISLHQSRAEPEDVPDSVMAYQPGLAYFTSVVLEPIGAPAAAHAQLKRAIKAIVANTKGVAEDKQLSTFVVPPGHARFKPPKRQPRERFDMLQLSWWFNHDRFLDAAEAESLLKTLGRYIPEAVPYRFGLFEPPQFKTEETGLGKLAGMLAGGEMVVCYTKKPVCGAAFGFYKSGMARGFGKLLYRTSYINLEFDAAVLDQPEWQSHLPTTWRALCGVIGPFFSDVRIIKDLITSGATYAVDGKSEHHPISAGWWDGVPDLNCLAMAFGGKFAEAWPNGMSFGQRAASCVYLEPETWTTDVRLSQTIAAVPAPVVQIDLQRN